MYHELMNNENNRYHTLDPNIPYYISYILYVQFVTLSKCIVRGFQDCIYLLTHCFFFFHSI
jgi:hypothetical protein